MRNELQAAVRYFEMRWEGKTDFEALAMCDRREMERTALSALRDALQRQPDPDTGLVDCGCGGSAGAWEQQTRKGVKHYVECESCEISTADYDTPQAAITAWNTAMGGEGGQEHDADR